MPPLRTGHVLLIPVLALALAAPAEEKPAPKAAEPPVPAKLERKNYTEKTKAWKKEITDPDAKPVKWRRVDTASKFEMVWVPGGEFTMGSPDTEAGREAHEGPRHKVKVNGFWMAKCEVTWDEYDVFWFDEDYLLANDEDAKKLPADAVTRPTNTFVDATYGHEREGHPAMCMTHHAAMMYCAWLKKKTGRNYRLPTEAEWEYAARGGKGDSPYFFGTDIKELEEHGWFKTNSPDDDHRKGTTHTVATRKPNPFGLCDLYGNVWEWTLDQHKPDVYAARAKIDLSIRPVTVPTPKKWAHVVRGGSWADTPDKLRSAARRVSDKSWMRHDPQEPQSIWWLTRMDVIGFRVVLAEDEQPELKGLRPLVVKVSE
jgi:formylglycine-generating enzyme required for sulfatase activity